MSELKKIKPVYIDQEERLIDQKERRLMQQEWMIQSVAFRVSEIMEERNVSRKELAERLGYTQGYVTQLLGGERNLTLRTLVDIFLALGVEDVFEALQDKSDMDIPPRGNSMMTIPYTGAAPKSSSEKSEAYILSSPRSANEAQEQWPTKIASA